MQVIQHARALAGNHFPRTAQSGMAAGGPAACARSLPKRATASAEWSVSAIAPTNLHQPTSRPFASAQPVPCVKHSASTTTYVARRRRRRRRRRYFLFSNFPRLLSFQIQNSEGRQAPTSSSFGRGCHSEQRGSLQVTQYVIKIFC